MRKMWKIAAVIALSGGAILEVSAAGAGAAGVGCGGKQIGQITVATLNGVPIVTLIANGAPVVLLLDTGAERSILTPAVAERIGAEHPRVEFDRRMHGIAGAMETHEVELRSFTIGGVPVPWRRIAVAPAVLPNVLVGPLDGILGADVLGSFDIDIDLPHYRMILYERQTCPAAAPDWTEPYLRIGTGRSASEHLFFPVQLDGRGIVAFVDTGAQRTTLTTRAALALGVSDAALARDKPTPVRGATGEVLIGHVHRFARLDVAGEAIRDPEIVVAGLTIRDADLVLGIDFVRSRRIWFSYGSLQIFLPRTHR